ncbi:MAG: hypothetical protein K0R18_116 [Bacillales bacterium]|jgi:hypothetical protein|nr:hypothetical protein [Bacillales bacterium]
MAENNNGGIFGNKGNGDFLKNLKNEVNNNANDISMTLDKVLRSISDFKDEVEKEKISLNIDTSYSQKIERMLSDLENDFNRLIAPVKGKIQQQISEVFSSDNVKTDGLTKELNVFSDALSGFATKVNQLSSEIGVNLGSAFENLNKETVETLRSFSDILAQLQQRDLKINNPFPEIIASLDEIAKRTQSIGSFNDVLSSILNIPVEHGTAYHLLELSDSLDIFNKTMRGTTDDDITKITSYINELEKLSQKTQVFTDIADSIKSLSVIGDIAKQVNDLNSALTALGQNSNLGALVGGSFNVPPIPQGPINIPPAIPPSGGGGGGGGNAGGGNPGPSGGGYNGPTSSYPSQVIVGPQPFTPQYSSSAHDKTFDAIEKALSKLQLNNMSGGSWHDKSSKNLDNESIKEMMQVLEQIKYDSSKLSAWEGQFKHASSNHDKSGAEAALMQMNEYRAKVVQGNSQLQGNLDNIGPKDLGKYPSEVRDIFTNMKDFQQVIQNIMINQFKFNEHFGLNQFNKEILDANRGINDFARNIENQPWDRIKGKLSSAFDPISKFTSGLKGGVTGGLGMLGLGSLGSALSIGGLAGGITDIYQRQGRLLADSAQGEILGGYDYDPQNTRRILRQGLDYQHSTHGRIQQEDYLNSYTSLVNNVRGHFGGQDGSDKASAQRDMESFASTATVMQGMGVSQGTTMSAITTFYKELGMSAKETDFQLVKIAQTAQSLNVPFEEHLKAVTNLATEYKAIGLSADQAGNVMGNLMFKGGMTSTEAGRFASNVGGALTNMNEGWLAYGAGMMGDDPLEAIMDLNYGYKDDGTMKEGVAEKKAQILTNNYQMFGGVGGDGGRYGMKEALKAMGITDNRDVAKFLNHAGDEKWLVNQFKEMDGKAGLGDLSEDNAKDKLTSGILGDLGKASDQLSGIDKSLNAYNEVLKRVVDDQRGLLDELTDFTGIIEKFGSMIEKVIGGMGNLLETLGKLANMDLSTIAALGIGGAGVLGGLASAGGSAFVMNKVLKRFRGSGGGSAGPTGGGAGGAGGPTRAQGGGGAAGRPSWLKSLTKSKSGKLAIAGAAGLAGWGAYEYFAGDRASAATDDGGGDDGSGGIFGNIYRVLQDILAALGGGGVVSASGIGGGGGRPSVDALADVSGVHDIGTNPWLATGVALGGTYAATKVGSSILSRMSTQVPASVSGASGGALSRVATAAASRPSAWSKLLSGGKSSGVAAGIFNSIGAGFEMHDNYELDALYGIENHGRSNANTWGKAAIGTIGSIAGGALGTLVAPGIGTVGGAIAGGMLADHFSDNIMGLFGAGSKDIEEDRMKNPLYKSTQEFMRRNGVSNEAFAVTASKGMMQYGGSLANFSEAERDQWGAKFAEGKGSGLTDEAAKEQANQMFRLNITNDDIKNLNAEQLQNGLELSKSTDQYQKDFAKYKEDFGKNNEATNKIIDETKSNTGLSLTKLYELYDVASNMPGDLAAAIKASGGLGNMDDPGKIERMRKQLEAGGLDVKQQERAMAGYLDNKDFLKSSMQSEEERNNWLRLYSMDPSCLPPGTDMFEYANNNINLSRKTQSLMSGGLLGDFQKFAGSKDGQLFMNDSANSLPSQFSSWDSMIKKYTKESDIDSSELKKILSKNHISEEQFGKYLLANDGGGNFGATNIAGINKDYISNGFTAVGEEKSKVAQEVKKQNEEQHKEAEKTKKELTEETTKAQDDIFKQGEEAALSRSKDYVSALKTLQDFLGDSIKNVWNKLQDINQTASDAVVELRKMASSGGSGGGQTGLGGTGKFGSSVNQWDELIQKVGAETGIDPLILKTIMQKESGGNANAKDNQNKNGTFDMGLMQINSDTAKGYGFDFDKLRSDPEYALRSAAKVIQGKKTMLSGMGEDSNDPHNIFHAYNGWSAQGGRYADDAMGYFDAAGRVGGSGGGFNALLGESRQLSSSGALSYKQVGGEFNGTYQEFLQRGLADCSQFVQEMYGNFLGKQLPRTAAEQWNAGTSVAKGQEQTGDLVFWNTTGKDHSHVGMYTGNGKAMQMGTNGLKEIDINSIDNYEGARRIGGSALYAGHNSAWNPITGKLDDIQKNTEKAADDAKKIADNTDAIKDNTTPDSSTKTSYKALLTNIGENDPYAGINIKGNMNNTKYLFDAYEKLKSKGIDYDDHGKDNQKWQQEMRHNFDVKLKVDFTDPDKSPQFQKILDKHLNLAVKNAMEEHTMQVSKDTESSNQALWNATTANSKAVQQGNYDG